MMNDRPMENPFCLSRVKTCYIRRRGTRGNVENDEFRNVSRDIMFAKNHKESQTIRTRVIRIRSELD